MILKRKNVSGIDFLDTSAESQNSELLSEMHEKLSQAVKLYDNLLTEQYTQTVHRQQTLSHPSHPQYSPHHQQQQPTQQPQQWTPQTAPISTYQAAYATQSVASPLAPEQSWAQNSVMYRPQANPSSPLSSVAPYSQEYVSAQPTAPVTQLAHYPMQQPAYPSSLPPVTLPLSPGLDHAAPQSNLIAQQTMVSQNPAPISVAPVQPALQQQPPSAQPSYQNYHPTNQSLSRSNTLTSAAQSQPQQPYVSHPHYQQQPQRVAPSAAPVAMPILPTAPTNAPSSYPLYGPAAAVPSAPASEPNEAMLISFD